MAHKTSHFHCGNGAKMVQIVENEEPNRIVELFDDKTVLITGATGFLGKVLIEKLLRVCNLRMIYVIVRPKKGKSVEQRLEEMFSGPLFEPLRKLHGADVFKKVEGIVGDISSENLGLGEDDRRKLVDEVEIVYHSAATVQFDEPLKKTVLLNVRGTKQMLDLAKECRKLVVFCYLSTAYCQETQEVLLEKTYPPPADPHRVIDVCERMNEETLNSIAHHVRGSSANNYTFTKALGEALVAEQMDNLPVIIQRPSAVVPIWKEPVPGWTDNINGPIGLMLGAGKGVIRTMYGQADFFADYVPVDIIANGLICSTYDYITYKQRRVYNMTASNEKRLTFQEIIDVGMTIVENRICFDWMLWYPGGSITSSRMLHYTKFLLFQLLPALFVDTILFLLGLKPFLLRVQRKIFRGFKIFEYYASRRWYFNHDNCEIFRGLLNENEKVAFKIDCVGFDYYDYFTECMLGMRRYLLKEKDENIPAARRRLKMMWIVDKLCKTIIVAGILYCIYQKVFCSLL